LGARAVLRDQLASGVLRLPSPRGITQGAIAMKKISNLSASPAILDLSAVAGGQDVNQPGAGAGGRKPWEMDPTFVDMPNGSDVPGATNLVSSSGGLGQRGPAKDRNAAPKPGA
jgi:hypothetical protein